MEIQTVKYMYTNNIFIWGLRHFTITKKKYPIDDTRIKNEIISTFMQRTMIYL